MAQQVQLSSEHEKLNNWLINSKSTHAIVKSPTMVNLFEHIQLKMDYEEIFTIILDYSKTLSNTFLGIDSEHEFLFNKQINKIETGLTVKQDVHFKVDVNPLIETFLFNLKLHAPSIFTASLSRRKRELNVEIGTILSEFIAARTTVKLQALQIQVSNFNIKNKLIFLDKLRNLDIVSEYRIPLATERNRIDDLISKIFFERISHFKSLSANEHFFPSDFLNRVAKKRKNLQSVTRAPINKKIRGDTMLDYSVLDDEVFDPIDVSSPLSDPTSPSTFTPTLTSIQQSEPMDTGNVRDNSHSISSNTELDSLEIPTLELEHFSGHYVESRNFLYPSFLNSRIRNSREVKNDYSDEKTKIKQFHTSLETPFNEDHLKEASTNKAQVILTLKTYYEIHQQNTKSFYLKSVIELLDQIENFVIQNITSASAELINKKFFDLKFNENNNLLEKYPVSQDNVSLYYPIQVCYKNSCLNRYTESELFLTTNKSTVCKNYIKLQSGNIYCSKFETLPCSKESFHSTFLCPIQPVLYHESFGVWDDNSYTFMGVRYDTVFDKDKRLALVSRYYPISEGLFFFLTHHNYILYLFVCNLITVAIFSFGFLKTVINRLLTLHRNYLHEREEMENLARRVNQIYLAQLPANNNHARAVPALRF